MSAWESTTTILELAAWLKGRRRVAVTTHIKPDGDALGSTLALARALRISAGKIEARCWYSGPMPDWARVIIGNTPVSVVEKDGLPSGAEAPDGVMVLDTGSWSQLEPLRPLIEQTQPEVGIVDHHLHGDTAVSARRLVDAGVAAVCEPVAELCAAILGVSGPSRLPVEVATPLFLGVATDTGWFRFSNVKPTTLRLAADLIQAGVDHSALYRMVEQQDKPSRLKLMARALESMEFAANGRVAVSLLTKQDFADARGSAAETGGFADLPLCVEAVLVSAVLTEAEPTVGQAGGQASLLTKVSMRSKPGAHAVDVNEVCRQLGGGGHARAAGARMNCGLMQARAKVLKALEEAVG